MFGKFGRAKDLSAKIEWEGGFGEFFCGYCCGTEFVNTPVEKEIADFYKAYTALYTKLLANGVEF